MKKSLILLLIATLSGAWACHKPEHVAPTADRQGITSLAAYFAFGPFEGQELGRLEIADPDVDRYVIPIPWYVPESAETFKAILKRELEKISSSILPDGFCVARIR